MEASDSTDLSIVCLRYRGELTQAGVGRRRGRAEGPSGGAVSSSRLAMIMFAEETLEGEKYG